MTTETFLTTVKEQMRCKKAQEPVCRELLTHIVSQAADYEKEGMAHEAAMEKAVREMGDPVELGASMDRVHRPRTSYAMLALVGVLSLFSIALHITLYQVFGDADERFYYLKRQIFYIAAGYLTMLGIYRLDYSFLRNKSRIIAVAFLIAAFFAIRTGASPVLLWLYVPIYGALLYGYRQKGYGVCLKMYAWTLAPMGYYLFGRGSLSSSFLLALTLSLVVLFSVAVAKGWYLVSKRVVLLGWWGVFLALPAALAGMGLRHSDIAMIRIKAFLHPEDYAQGAAFMQLQAKQILEGCRLFGANVMNLSQLGTGLAEANSDFILVSLTAAFGRFAAAAAVALLLGMVCKIFRIAFGQKNQLGMIVGCGCGIALFAQTAISVLVNLNLLPLTANTLPLFCFGGGTTMVTYILLGLALSIYRYQNIPMAGVARKSAAARA